MPNFVFKPTRTCIHFKQSYKIMQKSHLEIPLVYAQPQGPLPPSLPLQSVHQTSLDEIRVLTVVGHERVVQEGGVVVLAAGPEIVIKSGKIANEKICDALVIATNSVRICKGFEFQAKKEIHFNSARNCITKKNQR